ncbi:gliding motility-associated C-terminal domain-containing protein, partial [Ichthyenterobacterium sp. W332]
ETLPADEPVECDSVPTEVTLTATDNCGIATVTFSETEADGTCDGEIIITRIWTAADDCGNETIHTQTLTVQDTTPPTFNEDLPVNITVECDAVPSAAILTATDACSEATVVFIEEDEVGACIGETIITREWIATDACGNETVYTQTITAQDTTGPIFNEELPTDVTVECDELPSAAILTATDACGDTTLEFEELEEDGDCQGEIIITRIWTATDTCGNATIHTQTLTVQDTTGPVFNEDLPGDASVECDAIPEEVILTATDNCSEATLTFNEAQEAGSCDGEAIITRTWTASDVCGNETIHIQILTVQDTTAPALVGELNDITADCGNIPNVPELVFEDNCSDNISVTYNETTENSDVNLNYTIVREWTVADDCGNSAVFTQNVDVNVANTLTAMTDDLCNEEDFDYDLFNLISGNTDENGTWEVVSGNATLNGNFLNPLGLTVGDYIVMYTDSNTDCPSQVQATITIDDDCAVLPCGQSDVMISKAVTPNSDNINDFFTVGGIDTCGFTIELQIFNRWGAVVYQNNNYQNDWDGTTIKASVGSAGKVPTGTYYYVINLRNSGLQPFAGPIYVATN